MGRTASQGTERSKPMSDIRGRQFIRVRGGAAAWPLAARGQQRGKLPVIGYLGPESPAVFASRVRAFRQGLGETGYPRVEMSQSNFAGRKANTIDYLRWRQI